MVLNLFLIKMPNNACQMQSYIQKIYNDQMHEMTRSNFKDEGLICNVSTYPILHTL